MVMLLCIKQHLSNIWSSIHEKVKQNWGWITKKALLIKKCVIHKLDLNKAWTAVALYGPV